MSKSGKHPRKHKASPAKGAAAATHAPERSDAQPKPKGRPIHPATIGLLLVAVTAGIFLPLTGYDFINYDDPDYFSGNPHVQAGLTWAGLRWAFSTTAMSNWNPLVWWSFMLDVALFGKGPIGPHLTNLALHLANTVLLFAVLRRLTGAMWRSAFVAALFALHPLHVESVAWITERKDVLSTFFWMLTMGAYVKYCGVRSAECGSGRRTPVAQLWYLLALGFFACALMSKPMAVTLPFALLLMDYWPLGRLGEAGGRALRQLLLEKIPFFALSSVSSVITFRIHKASGAMAPLAGLSLGAKMANALVAYLRYLEKTAWPTRLALPYPHPGHWPILQVGIAAIVVLAVSGAAVWRGRRHPYLPVGWFWFLGTLVPVIGVIQWGSQSMADRFSYVPLIGVFIVIAWGGNELLARLRVGREVAAGAAGLVMVGCIVMARNQIGYWRNTETLFRHAVEVTDNNRVAYENLGGYLMEHGQLDDALVCYRKAVEIGPDRAQARNNLGGALLQKGEIREAIENLREAVRLDTNLASAYNNLGYALAASGDKNEAVESYYRALQLDPEQVSTYYNLGLLLSGQSKFEQAVVCFENTLRLKPDHVSAQYQLGLALAEMGRREEAIANLEKALRLKPDYSEAFGLLQQLRMAPALSPTRVYVE